MSQVAGSLRGDAAESPGRRRGDGLAVLMPVLCETVATVSFSAAPTWLAESNQHIPGQHPDDGPTMYSARTVRPVT